MQHISVLLVFILAAGLYCSPAIRAEILEDTFWNLPGSQFDPDAGYMSSTGLASGAQAVAPPTSTLTTFMRNFARDGLLLDDLTAVRFSWLASFIEDLEAPDPDLAIALVVKF